MWLPLTRPQPGTRPATQACALTGNRTGDALVHRLALNPVSHARAAWGFFSLHLSDFTFELMLELLQWT